TVLLLEAKLPILAGRILASLNISYPRSHAMPVLIAPDPSTTSTNVYFDISPIYDLFISLATMTHPGERDEPWSAKVKRDLSPQMREEADYFYSMFENRLVELAVDYPDHFDVEGFFRYV